MGPSPLPGCMNLHWLKSKHRQGKNAVISSDLQIKQDRQGMLGNEIKRSARLCDTYTTKFLARKLMEVESTNVLKI